MRLIKLISWMLLCGMVAAFVPLTQAQQPQGNRDLGYIIVAKVTGTVTATKLDDKTQQTLVADARLTENYEVTTAAGSSVILVFSNGATLNLGAESSLRIDEFLQDPFTTPIPLADLKEEPTTSVTRLHLTRGELVGNVKHLKQEQGSSFIVNTPVGAAGIRGTTFRIVFRPDSSGRVFFTLSTAEGAVLFTGESTTTAPVSVETGKEVVVNVEVNVDTTTGTVTVTAPPVIEATKDMPAETQAAIAAATNDAVVAASAVILSSTPPPSDTTKSDTTKEGEKKDDTKEEKTDTKDDTSKTDTSKTDTSKNGTPSSDNNTPDNGGFTPQNNNTPPPLPPSSKPTPGEGL